MMEPKVGQQYTLKNQPGSILTITRVWSEWNEIHNRNTDYVQYDIEHSDGRRANKECYSTRGNWDLGHHNHDLIEPEPEPCKGIEIEPGVFSGCNANETGRTDCPSCGPIMFLRRASDGKHRIVSSGDLTNIQIIDAMEHKKFFVDPDTKLGWALIDWECTTDKDRKREDVGISSSLRKSIMEKCRQYWNMPNLGENEARAAFTWIHEQLRGVE